MLGLDRLGGKVLAAFLLSTVLKFSLDALAVRMSLCQSRYSLAVTAEGPNLIDGTV